MKKLILLFLSFLVTSLSFSQELKEKKEDLNAMFKANYHVLASNKKVKQGLYQIFFKATDKVVAMGNYHQDTISGTWMFFNKDGELIERYNFDKNQLLYYHEAIDTSTVHYKFKIDLKPSDTIKVPIKIGGLFFGLGFVNNPNYELFTYMHDHHIQFSKILHYFEIDTTGKLVSWTSIVEKTGQSFVNSLENLNPIERLFIPAKIGKDSIPSVLIYQTASGISN